MTEILSNMKVKARNNVFIIAQHTNYFLLSSIEIFLILSKMFKIGSILHINFENAIFVKQSFCR